MKPFIHRRLYLLISCLFLSYSSRMVAATLNNINATVTSQKTTEITFQFSTAVNLPKNFSTSIPQRIVLDFFDVDKTNANPKQAINRGNITTINNLSANGRTRIIINLQQQTAYKIVMHGNSVTLTLNTNPLTVITPPSSLPTDHIKTIPVTSNNAVAHYTGKPISLNFQNISIRSILAVLAEFTGTNIVAADSVAGNITLRLNNIPWDEALEIILKSSNLGKKQVGDVIMVAPLADLAAQEKQLLTAQQNLQQIETLQTRYRRLNYAKVAEVAALIKDQSTSLLSNRGNVSADQRTNTLIIQDTPSSLMNIEKLVEKLDVPVQQVMIEARIVNVDTSFEQDLGIRWRTTNPDHLSGTLNGTLINEQTGVVNPVSAVPFNDRLNVDLPAHAIDGNQPASVGIALAKLDDGYMLDLELSAIETEGGGELISSPRLVTANQHPALIEAGTEIPYQQNTSSGATAVEFKKAVLSLKVTPQITPDGKIIMDIKVNQDKVDRTLEVDGVPAIDTREIETNVLADNGETIVLGGIYEEEQSKQVARVPFLGSIPVLGYFFRNTDKIDKRKELLIFITPKVIPSLPITNEKNNS